MKLFGIIITWLLLITPTAAFLPTHCRADTDTEIRHLTAFIGDSECIFIRNGAEHESADALKHILRKYNATKKRIHIAEDFIRLAATKSSLSGKPYKVRCGNSEMLCADWLHTELDRYREGAERLNDAVGSEVGQ